MAVRRGDVDGNLNLDTEADLHGSAGGNGKFREHEPAVADGITVPDRNSAAHLDVAPNCDRGRFDGNQYDDSTIDYTDCGPAHFDGIATEYRVGEPQTYGVTKRAAVTNGLAGALPW